MPEREETLAFLGLYPGASLSEIEHAYALRSAAAAGRLAGGDESARVELAALREAYERLLGRSPLPPQIPGVGAESAGVVYAGLEEGHMRIPPWWECYLSLLLAFASVAGFALLVAYLPHVYHKGGFLIPLALIASSVLLSILATMLAEDERQVGLRSRLLKRKGLEAGYDAVPLRGYTARFSSLLSRVVRWLLVPALIATILLNFASLSGHWSLRR